MCLLMNFKLLSFYFIVMSGRTVSQHQQKVTLLTDVKLMDHSEFDKYFQVIFFPGVKMVEWRNMLKNQDFRIKCDVVWIMIGDGELPLRAPDFSPVNQMRKLLN